MRRIAARIFVTMPLHEPLTHWNATSALHLTSLLHLSTQLSELQSAEQVLNAAVLSIMGKLRLRRACILHPDGDLFLITHCKGVLPLPVSQFAIDECTYALAATPAMQPLADQGIEWLVPLIAHGELLNVLCFGGSVDGLAPQEDTRSYIELVRAIATTAVHNTRMVSTLIDAKKALEGQTLLVTTLYESARDFTGKLEPNEIARILSYRLMGQLMTSSFALVLDEPLGGTTIAAQRGTIDDAALEIPIHTRGIRRGVLLVGPKLNGNVFSPEEITFAEALGNTAMIALETYRLVQVEIERGAFLKQMEIAAQIQQGLLPVQLPETPGLDVAAATTPSAHIGGDYYDVLPLDGGRTLFAIADVAGKGIPAALLMANVQAALNTLAPLDLGLPQIATRINRLVYDNTAPEVFVTMFLAIIEHDTRVLTYVNAGHNPPFVLSDGNVVYLKTGGVLSGVLPDPPPYESGSIVLTDNSVLVLYTDGVTEARNADGDEYEPERLVSCVQSLAHLSALDILIGIHRNLDEFSTTDLPDDDTSLIVVKPT